MAAVQPGQPAVAQPGAGEVRPSSSTVLPGAAQSSAAAVPGAQQQSSARPAAEPSKAANTKTASATEKPKAEGDPSQSVAAGGNAVLTTWPSTFPTGKLEKAEPSVGRGYVLLEDKLADNMAVFGLVTALMFIIAITIILCTRVRERRQSAPKVDLFLSDDAKWSDGPYRDVKPAPQPSRGPGPSSLQYPMTPISVTSDASLLSDNSASPRNIPRVPPPRNPDGHGQYPPTSRQQQQQQQENYAMQPVRRPSLNARMWQAQHGHHQPYESSPPMPNAKHPSPRRKQPPTMAQDPRRAPPPPPIDTALLSSPTSTRPLQIRRGVPTPTEGGSPHSAQMPGSGGPSPWAAEATRAPRGGYGFGEVVPNGSGQRYH